MKLHRIFPKVEGCVYIRSDGVDRKTRKLLMKNESIPTEVKFNFDIELNGGEWPDLMSSGNGLFYISNKLKGIFERSINSEDLIFIPTYLKDGDYFLICPKTLDVLDYEKSELELYQSGAISEVIKLVVHGDRIHSLTTFRLQEKYIHIFITDELKNVLVSKNLKGIQFLNAINLSESY